VLADFMDNYILPWLCCSLAFFFFVEVQHSPSST
jgi:hypothetical protein